MFKEILLPTDGSAAALHAAENIAGLTGSTRDTRVTVVVVTLPLDTRETDLDIEFIEAHNARMCHQAECALKATSDILEEQGIAHTAKVLQGNPVSAVIAKEALAGGYDLIAMSSRGMGMQHDNLHYMGSVTEHVIRRVSIPVLVFPAQDD
jgi:nucleotide-binding universal stress UspA family protein